MVELAELKVFVAAAEEGSFSQAAKRLDYSQSAVSQRIKALEQTFGVALFLRRGRSVHLTEAGQMLLPLARDVLNAAHLLEDAMNNLEGQVVGELVIGCSTTSGKYLLPGLAAAFRQEYHQGYNFLGSIHVNLPLTMCRHVTSYIQIREGFPMTL